MRNSKQSNETKSARQSNVKSSGNNKAMRSTKTNDTKACSGRSK